MCDGKDSAGWEYFYLGFSSLLVEFGRSVRLCLSSLSLDVFCDLL